jgi:hypothetical protein
MANHLNLGLIDMKTKQYLRKAREKYVNNDLDGALMNLTYSYAMGSDIAA